MSQGGVGGHIMPLLMEAERKISGKATEKSEAASSVSLARVGFSLSSLIASSIEVTINLRTVNGKFCLVPTLRSVVVSTIESSIEQQRFLAVTPSTFDGCCLQNWLHI